MILRDYQRRAVTACVAALKKHGNTLLIAATGSGKTVMLSAIAKDIIGRDKRCLVVQHRDELTDQNAATFNNMFPGTYATFYNATKKSWRGQVIFSMIQTLAKDKNLNKIPPVDLLIIDEAHHSASISYRKIIEKTKSLNPKVKILGCTATPERTDKKGLKETFTNVAEIIDIEEMVKTGHLVPPRGMVIDIGTQRRLQNVKKTANDYNMAEVEVIQNSKVLNKKVIENWIAEAVDRPTVAFCSTIQHALDVRDAFRDAGYTSETVSSHTPKKERRKILKSFDEGKINVMSNPLLLGEGWDCQLCSCIMLLRPSSHKSTMIQMVGRGLRKINPNRYPGIIKKDCKVLDFGISLINHGDLKIDCRLKFDRNNKDVISTKNCPNCNAELPINAQICAICGYEFKILPKIDNGDFDELEEFKLIEIDLINNSPFRWINIAPSGKIIITTGFGYWAAVVSKDERDWYAISGKDRNNIEILNISNKINAITSADDYMRANSTSVSAKKAAKWMLEPISDKQQRLLANIGRVDSEGMSKIDGAAHITFYLNLKKIEKLIGV